MRLIFKTAISVALAVALGLSFSNTVVGDTVVKTSGNEGLNQSEDADLDRIQTDDPDQDRIQPDDPDQDRDQPDDPDQDMIQDGDQTDTSNEGTEDMSEHQYQYVHEEHQPSQGVAVDQNLLPVQTQTHFRARLSTDEDLIENGKFRLNRGNHVKLESEVSVDDEDAGKTVECLVVGQYKADEEGEQQTFMLAENGWEEWDGNFDELAGRKCQLGESHEIVAYEGELIAGEFNFYFGYQFENGGLVAAPLPVSFTVR